jgi:hypothetical protein
MLNLQPVGLHRFKMTPARRQHHGISAHNQAGSIVGTHAPGTHKQQAQWFFLTKRFHTLSFGITITQVKLRNATECRLVRKKFPSFQGRLKLNSLLLMDTEKLISQSALHLSVYLTSKKNRTYFVPLRS